MLRELLEVLTGPTPEPESIRALRRFSDELTEAATTLRQVSARARLLNERAGHLMVEVNAWNRRVAHARAMGEPELMISAAKAAGRVHGELEAARTELGRRLDEELFLRETVVSMRRRWLRLLEQAEQGGLDTSRCVLTIDLTRPAPPDDLGLADDEETEWLARVLDGVAQRASSSRSSSSRQ